MFGPSVSQLQLRRQDSTPDSYAASSSTSSLAPKMTTSPTPAVASLADDLTYPEDPEDDAGDSALEQPWERLGTRSAHLA
eukprot:8256266-Alexandrium_andersonii.AAC.1